MEDRSTAGPGTSAVDEGKSSSQGKAVQCMTQSVLSCRTVKSQGCLQFFSFLFDCTVLWGREFDS